MVDERGVYVMKFGRLDAAARQDQAMPPSLDEKSTLRGLIHTTSALQTCF
jgi:hypothetical protein